MASRSHLCEGIIIEGTIIFNNLYTYLLAYLYIPPSFFLKMTISKMAEEMPSPS